MRFTKSLTLTLAVALAAPVAFGQLGIGPIRHSVPSANQRVDRPDTVIARGFRLKQLAAGVDPLENPSAKITQFGLLAAPGPNQTRTSIFRRAIPADQPPATTTEITSSSRAMKIPATSPTSPA